MIVHSMSHIVTCQTSQAMHDKLNSVYQQDTEQQRCKLLQDFYNFQFDDVDVMANISCLRNIVSKLSNLEQIIDETMVITKILTELPERFKYFGTARDSTRQQDRTLENLAADFHKKSQVPARTRGGRCKPRFHCWNKKTEPRYLNCYVMGHIRINCPKSVKGKFCRQSNHTESESLAKKNQE